MCLYLQATLGFVFVGFFLMKNLSDLKKGNDFLMA